MRKALAAPPGVQQAQTLNPNLAWALRTSLALLALLSCIVLGLLWLEHGSVSGPAVEWATQAESVAMETMETMALPAGRAGRSLQLQPLMSAFDVHLPLFICSCNFLFNLL